jgi:hypothetical protein
MTDTRKLTLADLISDAMAHRLFEVHCSKPGRIKSWDETTGLAEVEVCINPTFKHDDGEEAVVHGVISNVPIEFPSGGGYMMSFPLAVGDPVKLTFHDHSLDLWLEKGGVVDVKDLRSHHATDASASLGLRARPDALTGLSKSKLIIGKVGDPSLQITIDGSVIKLSDNATKFVALAEDCATEFSKIQTALTAIATVLTAAPSGTPVVTLAPPLGVYVPGSVAASKVKAQ